MSEPVVLVMEGGVLHGVYTDADVMVVLVDFDEDKPFRGAIGHWGYDQLDPLYVELVKKEKEYWSHKHDNTP